MSSLPADRAELGRLAEAIAADYLQSRGGRVLARNVATLQGEVDLIVDWGDEAAVVEVRSARSEAGDDRLFTAKKEQQVRRLAATLDPPIFRIDAVTVLFGASGVRVRWHRRV